MLTCNKIKSRKKNNVTKIRTSCSSKVVVSKHKKGMQSRVYAGIECMEVERINYDSVYSVYSLVVVGNTYRK